MQLVGVACAKWSSVACQSTKCIKPPEYLGGKAKVVSKGCNLLQWEGGYIKQNHHQLMLREWQVRVKLMDLKVLKGLLPGVLE